MSMKVSSCAFTFHIGKVFYSWTGNPLHINEIIFFRSDEWNFKNAISDNLFEYFQMSNFIHKKVYHDLVSEQEVTLFHWKLCIGILRNIIFWTNCWRIRLTGRADWYFWTLRWAQTCTLRWKEKSARGVPSQLNSAQHRDLARPDAWSSLLYFARGEQTAADPRAISTNNKAAGEFLSAKSDFLPRRSSAICNAPRCLLLYIRGCPLNWM